MPTRTVRLNYPATLLRQPILHQFIREFDLTVNIVRAQMSLEEGWLEIEVDGSMEELDRGQAWLETQGVQVILLD
ncbi:MAG TPA: NIL domain-containing protein [Anaerolineales bacterium]|nr:NIL domain-containing protein [Anaerolineales bacterium]